MTKIRYEGEPWTWAELREIANGPTKRVHEFCAEYGRAGALALRIASRGTTIHCSRSLNGLPSIHCHECPLYERGVSCGTKRAVRAAWYIAEAEKAGIPLVEVQS